MPPRLMYSLPWKPFAFFHSFTPHRRPERLQLVMNEAERLHLGFLGEPFLFKNFRLDSFGSFIAAASLVAAICLSER